MPVSSVQSGHQIIQQSQSLADEAANEISQVSETSSLDFNKVEQIKDTEKPKEKPSLEDALTKLNHSNTYSQVGANIIQRSDDMVGTLLDTQI